MYYIIKPDGTSIFEQAYPFDFCLHCLFLLIDNPNSEFRNCKLLSFDFTPENTRYSGARCVSLSAPVFAISTNILV